MNKKSKFVTFILSFIPGLGHIYLGIIQRGLVFLLASAFVIFGGTIFSMMHIFYGQIPFVILPFIWLAALVDSLILADKINRKLAEGKGIGLDSSTVWSSLEEELKGQNGKILALTFSIFPGAGHMYIGQMEKGIQLMAAFFLTLYLSDFLNISLLLMIAPILWFYSIFDILHKVSDPEKTQEVTFIGDFFRESQFSGKKGKILGIGLIVVGVIMVSDKIILPQLAFLLDEHIEEYIRTGIIALLFIGGGIKLMLGSKDKNRDKNKTEMLPIVNGTTAEEIGETSGKGVEEE